jgi:hypothetical protein
MKRQWIFKTKPVGLDITRKEIIVAENLLELWTWVWWLVIILILRWITLNYVFFSISLICINVFRGSFDNYKIELRILICSKDSKFLGINRK